LTIAGGSKRSNASHSAEQKATGAKTTLRFVGEMTRNGERALGALRESLLGRRSPEARDGDEAFDLHLLLAIALYRVA